jgi:hypothetical protein
VLRVNLNCERFGVDDKHDWWGGPARWCDFHAWARPGEAKRHRVMTVLQFHPTLIPSPLVADDLAHL